MSVHFLCSESDTRFSSLKDVRKDDLLLYAAPPLTRNILKLPLFALRFAASVVKASRIIGKMNAGAVIGMGGYVSAPALIAAVFRGVPLYLCEQNTVPGRVTSVLHAVCRQGVHDLQGHGGVRQEPAQEQVIRGRQSHQEEGDGEGEPAKRPSGTST